MKIKTQHRETWGAAEVALGVGEFTALEIL
jgi:hypothetical protein